MRPPPATSSSSSHPSSTEDRPSSCPSELTSLSIAALRERLRRREVSALDAARAHLDRIEALDERTVRAMLTVTRETAEQQARQADARIAAGEDGPLLGVPMILKDVLVTRGIRTTGRLEDARQLHSAGGRDR